jgi:hypothetical protein
MIWRLGDFAKDTLSLFLLLFNEFKNDGTFAALLSVFSFSSCPKTVPISPEYFLFYFA